MTQGRLGRMALSSLVKNERILKAIKELEWEEPTPVQEQVIPIAFEGKDVMAQAQTGTGKTGAFAIPVIDRIQRNRRIQCLVMTPTRELAVQVTGDLADMAKHSDIRTVAIYGGQSITMQVDKLRQGVEIVVGTPGRLMDLMRRGELNFDGV